MQQFDSKRQRLVHPISFKYPFILLVHISYFTTAKLNYKNKKITIFVKKYYYWYIYSLYYYINILFAITKLKRKTTDVLSSIYIYIYIYRYIYIYINMSIYIYIHAHGQKTNLMNLCLRGLVFGRKREEKYFNFAMCWFLLISIYLSIYLSMYLSIFLSYSQK